ncbi:MAG: C40 family peptidase [Spirochaetales bacterium]|nr:C40 family peptidase [Spirochaetales bacterium]
MYSSKDTIMRAIFLSGLLLIFIISGISATTITFEQTGTGVAQKRIVEEAKSYLGVPYVWGGTTSKGLDCSGLVFRVFSDILNRSLSRNVESLKKEGKKVKGDLLPADLVFFDTSGGGYATHVGIYIGASTFIHAASAGRKTGIIISALTEKYYKERYLGAGRLLDAGFPLVKIDIDNRKTVQSGYPGELSPGIPVYFSVTGSYMSSDFIEFIAYRDKKAVIEKRIRLSEGETPAVLWFIPDKGRWSVMFKSTDNKKIAKIVFY